MNNELIYIDLFSGVGGFAKGFQDAGVSIKHHYYSEIDKNAIAVYKYQFKNTEYVGSVTDVSGTELKKRHPKARFIITFGFPCQDLSIAGRGKGLSGERSGLFFEAIRIIKEVNPEIFIFENVKGLLSSNEGKDFETVLRTIADIGLYECEWQLVNTAWVLPQNRERIYFVGHSTGRSKPRVFPFRKGDSIFAERGREGQRESKICTAITQSYSKGVHNGGETYIIQKTGGYTTTVKKNTTGTLQAGGSNVMDKVPNACIPVLTPDRKEKRQNGRRFKEDGEPAFTLNTQDMHGVMITQNGRGKNKGGEKGVCPTITSNAFEQNHSINQIRRLTEIECERLQGFPDNWTQYGDYDGKIKKVAKTHRYRQMGNAVTTHWPRMIAERLFNE